MSQFKLRLILPIFILTVFMAGTALAAAQQQGEAGISLAKSAPDEVKPGQVIDYQIEVANTGNMTLTGVIVRDPIPQYMIDPDQISHGGAVQGNEVVWNIGDMTPGESLVLSWRGLVNPVIPTTETEIVNRVTASTDLELNAEVEASNTVLQPEMLVIKTATNPVMPGQVIDYEITVVNSGPVVAYNAILTDILPSGADYIPGAASDGGQVVALTTRGIQRSNAKDFSYRVKAGLSSRAVEAHLVQLRLTPEDSVILVSNRGRCWKAPVGRVPDKANFADLGLDKGEYIIGGGVSSSEKYLVIGTQGNIKRTKVDDLTVSEASWASVIGLNGTDEVLFVGVVSDEATVMFFTSGGKAIHFRVSTVNPQPTPSARGVAGIKLVKDDVLVAGVVVEPDDQARVVIVSETGYIKRVKLGEFPIKGRHTQGVQSLEITKSTGQVVAAAVTLGGTKYCDVLSTKGQRQWLVIDKIPLANRRKRGELLIKLSKVIKAVGMG